VERQQLEAAVVDLDVELVDGGIAAEHALNQGSIAVDQAPHREAHAFLGQAAHFEQTGFDMIEFVLKVANMAVRRHKA
jgi:hypothetical protein